MISHRPATPEIPVEAPHLSLIDLLPEIHRSGQGLWCFSIESTLGDSKTSSPHPGVIREIARLAACGNAVAIISKQLLGSATERVASALAEELKRQNLSKDDASRITICGEHGEYLVYHTGERFVASATGLTSKGAPGIASAQLHYLRREGTSRPILITIGTLPSDLALPQTLAPGMRTVHVHFGSPLDIPPFGLPYQIIQTERHSYSAIEDFLDNL